MEWNGQRVETGDGEGRGGSIFLICLKSHSYNSLRMLINVVMVHLCHLVPFFTSICEFKSLNPWVSTLQ